MSDESKESKSGKYLPWEEGLPTRPDIDALMKQWPPDQMKIGDQYSDDQVRAVIGIQSVTRYRTVYAAWIKRLLKEHRINLFRQKEKGFYVPSDALVLACTHPTLMHIGRSAGKQMRSLAVIKPEDQISVATRDHHGVLLGMVKRESRKARMNILLPGTVKDQVRIEAPKKDIAK